MIKGANTNTLGLINYDLIYARIGGVEYGTRQTDTVLSIQDIPHLSMSLNIYPNPVSSEGAPTLTFSMQKSGTVTMRIIDLLGREIYRAREMQWYDQGQHTVRLDALALQPGLVFFELITPAGRLTKAIVVKK
jgi:hypothetical protein